MMVDSVASFAIVLGVSVPECREGREREKEECWWRSGLIDSCFVNYMDSNVGPQVD